MIISTSQESINFKAKDNVINGDISLLNTDDVANQNLKIECVERCTQKFSVKFLIMFSKVKIIIFFKS